jgi:hypothetical protein
MEAMMTPLQLFSQSLFLRLDFQTHAPSSSSVEALAKGQMEGDQ